MCRYYMFNKIQSRNKLGFVEKKLNLAHKLLNSSFRPHYGRPKIL